jgi:hypothetical protein
MEQVDQQRLVRLDGCEAMLIGGKPHSNLFRHLLPICRFT